MRRFAAPRLTRVAACLAVCLALLAIARADDAGATSPWLSSASSMTCARDSANVMTCWGGTGQIGRAHV